MRQKKQLTIFFLLDILGKTRFKNLEKLACEGLLESSTWTPLKHFSCKISGSFKTFMNF